MKTENCRLRNPVPVSTVVSQYSSSILACSVSHQIFVLFRGIVSGSAGRSLSLSLPLGQGLDHLISSRDKPPPSSNPVGHRLCFVPSNLSRSSTTLIRRTSKTLKGSPRRIVWKGSLHNSTIIRKHMPRPIRPSPIPSFPVPYLSPNSRFLEFVILRPDRHRPSSIQSHCVDCKVGCGTVHPGVLQSSNNPQSETSL